MLVKQVSLESSVANFGFAGGCAVLLSVAYVSRPKCRFTNLELADLWEGATEKNERLGITGGLYYDGRVFFHVLEGDSAVVWPLLERIRQDPRHSDLEVLAENDIASPSFRYWPVKFIDGRGSERLQEKFAPEALGTMRLADLNSNAFMLAML